MLCGRCKRKIAKKDVESGNYSRSSFSKLHYCNRKDCRTKDKADKVRSWGRKAKES